MTKYIYRYWAHTGLFISIFIISYIYFIESHKIFLSEKLILLNLAFLMIHQFEEYVYPGGFKEYFNNNIYNPFGFFRNKLTNKGIIWINVIFGWGMNIVTLLFLSSYPFAVLIVIAILFINGIIHFIVTFKTQYYNPGVITGALLFLPLGFYAYYKFLPDYHISNLQLIIIFLTAAFLSLLIPITIFATRKRSHR